jgi:hypothetical protein
VELLENVLLNLTCECILKYYRVCKQWRNTILGSNQIQVVLGFRSIKADPEYELRSRGHLPDVFTTHNRIKAYAEDDVDIKSALMGSPSVEQIFTDMKIKVATGLLYLNPVVHRIFPLQKMSEENPEITSSWCSMVNLLRHLNSRSLLLRRAWMTQPPIKQVELEITISIDDVAAHWDNYRGEPIWSPQLHEASLGWRLRHSGGKHCFMVASKIVSYSHPNGLTIADLLLGITLTARPLYDSINERACSVGLPVDVWFRIVSAA